jgi:hypothetical protein
MPKNLFAKSLTSCAIAQEKVKPKQKSQRLLFFSFGQTFNERDQQSSRSCFSIHSFIMLKY